MGYRRTPIADNNHPGTASHPPTGVKAEAAPNDPNTVAKWTIEFINGQVATTATSDPDMLSGGTGNDFVIIEFEDDVQFPESIDSRHITITATDPRLDPDHPDHANRIGTLVANPLGQPTIEKVAEYKGENPQLAKTIDETQVTLNIPDMEPSEVHTGSQGILGGAKVTIVFGQTAGIRNPTESKPTKATASFTKAWPTNQAMTSTLTATEIWMPLTAMMTTWPTAGC